MKHKMHRDPDGQQCVDFDALAAKPIRIRAGGKTYEVPGDLPTTISLEAVRNAHKGSAEEQEAFGIGLLKKAIGEEAYDEIEANTGINQYKAIVDYLLGQWGFGEDSKDGGEGKPQEKASQSRSTASSINGDLSSLTLAGTGEPGLPTSAQEVG